MRTVHEDHVTKSLVAVVESGEDAVSALTQLAHDDGIGAASFIGIGVFAEAVIGYLNPHTNSYDEFTIDEPAEVTAFSGTISLNHGQPEIHAHAALGMADTTVRGGHLIRAAVHPTLEVSIDVYDSPLHCRFDEATGQELIAP